MRPKTKPTNSPNRWRKVGSQVKIQAALERSEYQRDFDAARSPKTAEQDNDRQKDTGRTERGGGETGDQSGSTKPRRQRRPRGPRNRNGPDRSR